MSELSYLEKLHWLEAPNEEDHKNEKIEGMIEQILPE